MFHVDFYERLFPYFVDCQMHWTIICALKPFDVAESDNSIFQGKKQFLSYGL